jgi:hypothetical protein
MNLKNCSTISLVLENKKKTEVFWPKLNKFQKKSFASYLVDKVIEEGKIEVTIDKKNVVLTLDKKGTLQCKEKN